LKLGDLLVIDIREDADLAFGTLFVLLDLAGNIDVAAGDVDILDQLERQLFKRVAVERGALLQPDLFAFHEVFCQLAAFEKLIDALVTLFLKDPDLVLEVAAEAGLFHRLDIERTFILILALAGKDLDVNDGPVNARRAGERGVLNVAGLFAEDRTEQLLFRSQLGLALGRNLSDEDRARLDLSTDANDARFIKVAEHILADVRDVASDLLRAELGITGLDLELLNVDRGVEIVLDQAFRNEDRVLEVVTPPGHECHQHVAA